MDEYDGAAAMSLIGWDSVDYHFFVLIDSDYSISIWETTLMNGLFDSICWDIFVVLVRVTKYRQGIRAQSIPEIPWQR